MIRVVVDVAADAWAEPVRRHYALSVHAWVCAIVTMCALIGRPTVAVLAPVGYLIGAGMSLVGVMKLLGHHSFQMTLRYTAVTQEHTGREYFAAMQRIEQRYLAAPPPAINTTQFDPIKATTDIIAWLQNNVASQSKAQERAVRVLSKRLIRAQSQIHALLDEKTTGKVAS